MMSSRFHLFVVLALISIAATVILGQMVEIHAIENSMQKITKIHDDDIRTFQKIDRTRGRMLREIAEKVGVDSDLIRKIESGVVSGN